MFIPSRNQQHKLNWGRYTWSATYVIWLACDGRDFLISTTTSSKCKSQQS